MRLKRYICASAMTALCLTTPVSAAPTQETTMAIEETEEISSTEEAMESSEGETEPMTTEEAQTQTTVDKTTLEAASDIEGDAGDTQVGGVQPGPDTAFVTFKSQLPVGVHDDVLISVMNTNTYVSYLLTAYERHGSSVTAALPDGEYLVDQVRLVHDKEDRYNALYSTFTVNAGVASVEIIEVLDKQINTTTEAERPDGTGLTESLAQIQQSEAESHAAAVALEKEQEEESHHMSVWNIIFLALMVGLPIIGMGIYAVKHIQTGADDDF